MFGILLSFNYCVHGFCTQVFARWSANFRFYFSKKIGQDVAAAIDEEDVGKFTEVIKEFDSMTPLVSSELFIDETIFRCIFL